MSDGEAEREVGTERERGGGERIGREKEREGDREREMRIKRQSEIEQRDSLLACL